MSKFLIGIITALFLSAGFSNCKVAKKIVKIKSSLTPKKKMYVDYNSVFDKEGNNLNPNRLSEFSTDNKIRIVTINRITNDTIIEWVDPIEIGSGKRVFLNTPTEPEPEVIAMPIIVKDTLPSHYSLRVEYDSTYSPPMYFKRKDTIILRGAQNEIANLLLNSKENKFAATKSEVSAKAAKPLPKRKLDANNRAAKNNNKAAKPIDKTKTVDIPKSDENKIVIIDSNYTIPENQLTVGDAFFDKDLSATIEKDEFLINEYLRPKIVNWNTFKCKAKVYFNNKGKSQNFNAAIRMKKDSVTWASVIVLGELARAIISKDSLLAIDKWNDKYYRYPVNQLQEMLNLPLSFNEMQDLILGNLSSKGMTIVIAKKSAKGFAIKLKGNGLNSILSFNKDSTLKSATIFGTNKKGKYAVKSTYDKYTETTHGLFAQARTIRMLQNTQETFVELDLQKLEFEGDLEFPFSIPEKFKEATLIKSD
jgi:Domain of unknown function (DUF4292)